MSTGTRLPSFLKYSFSKGCNDPIVLSAGIHSRLSRSSHSGGVSSVQRMTPRYEVLTVVAHDTQKRVIGLENPTFEIPNHDADDVCVDEAPDLRFAFGEIAVQTGILQRDRGLRGEQLQHRYARWGKHAGREAVLEVEHADQLCLGEQGQAENRARPPLTDVRISGERGLGRGIIEDHAFPGTQDIMENGLRQRGPDHRMIVKPHEDRVAAGCGFGREPWLALAHQNEQASFGAGLLEGGAQKRIDQFDEDDLARNSLRDLYYGREVELVDRRPDRVGRPDGGQLILELGIGWSSWLTLASAPQRE